MQNLNDKVAFPDEDFLNIAGLKRSDWDNFWHPNGEFLKTLQYSGIQIYILEGTIYGCFVNAKLNSKVETQWFGYHLSSVKNHEGKLVPNSTFELYQILEFCEPEKTNGLIFNLDLLKDS